jgi:glycerophosphoryl diester phosphodiesterase
MRHRAIPLARSITVVALVAVWSGCSSDAGSSVPATTSVAAPTTSAPTTSAPTTSPAITTVPTTAAPAASAPTTAPSTTAPPTTAPPTTVPVAPLTIDELLTLGRPIVLAHAGGEDERPHSLAFSFGESVKAGVDMLDFDVQLTGDGVLVVQHDETVDRTTNGTGNIADMTYAELSKLDNAYWFTTECTCPGKPDDAYIYRGIRTGDQPAPTGYTPDDFAVPRFSDIVRRFPQMPLNIEIKGSGDPAIAAAKELAKELTDLDRLSNAVVTSFDDAVVEAFHGFAPTVELTPGLGLASEWVLNRTPLPGGMRILQLPPEFNGTEVLTPAVMTDSHAAGYVIWVWPNNRALENPASYDAFLQQGMDGLNINYPAEGVAAVDRFVGA